MLSATLPEALAGFTNGLQNLMSAYGTPGLKRDGRSQRELLDLGELLRLGKTHKPFVVIRRKWPPSCKAC